MRHHDRVHLPPQGVVEQGGTCSWESREDTTCGANSTRIHACSEGAEQHSREARLCEGSHMNRIQEA